MAGLLYYLPIVILILLLINPVSGTGEQPAPEYAEITIYLIDFNNLDIVTGTVEVDCYLVLKSSENISLNNLELMNGMITSSIQFQDSPTEKEYRIKATLAVVPNLIRYPFDSHIIPIKLEPKLKDSREMLIVTNESANGIGPDADLPGWEITRSWSETTSMTYRPGEIPFSRIIFNYEVRRDTTSTILKFFLPVILIVIISLSSLFLKFSSRLALNASMFLSVVMIHWRIAGTIPVVTYAMFLDLFMIITYGTLGMVLISGIFALNSIESEDTKKAELIQTWSLRLIPTVSIALYLVLIAAFFLER